MKFVKAKVWKRLNKLSLSRKEKYDIYQQILDFSRCLGTLQDFELHDTFLEFVDRDVYPLIESYKQLAKEKPAAYVNLSFSCNLEQMRIIYWFLNYKNLDPEINRRIFHDKDYYLFWNELKHMSQLHFLERYFSKRHDLTMFYIQGRLKTLTDIYLKEWLTIDELALYANLSIGTIYNYVSKGTIPYTKKGGLLFNKKKIDDWLAKDEFDPIAIRKSLPAKLV